ncbi:MAG: DUF1501 domain-containing protein [Gemmataceae bacterium]|nr:DUF1501 domain-containing protein [Gemmata sp.]MDW8198557.1 DUF1501 domain-containing protein [Gemmataceae bacterium]
MRAIAPGTWKADPSHFTRPTRRDLLRVGWLGGLGLTLGDFFQLQAAAAETGRKIEAKAQSVIHIYLQGGFPHMDSFDPKPDAPAEYRGILDTVATKLPGVRFSEHMAKTATIADKLTIVRAMSHTEVDHSRGEHSMFTGYRPSPALTYPSMGSVTAHELGVRNNMPPYIVVPTAGSQYLNSGYLSNQYGPFALGADPGRSGFTVRDLSLPPQVDDARFHSRREWKELVDEHFAKTEKDDQLTAMDSFYQRAYGMLSSPTVRNAFSLKGETEATKKLYGMTGLTGPLAFRNAGAARFLMARRLIEAGARFVTITFGAWDTHAFHYRGIENQMPLLDIAFSGLITDLDQRGLLKDTLVVLNSEFGRTPKINAGGGRDHWPRVFSIVLAGGGVKAGHVYGESDALAAEPRTDPLSVEDYAHTLYHLIGIDAKKDLMSPGNRPQPIVMNGKVVKGLLA